MPWGGAGFQHFDFCLAVALGVRSLSAMAQQGMDIHDVAHLARLELTAEDEAHLGAQLGHVLEYIEKLNSLDVSGVEPMAHTMPRVNVMRADVIAECLAHEDAMLNAPSTSNGLFKVPKIVE